MKYQDLKAKLDNFDVDFVKLNHSLSADDIPKAKESLKTGVEMQFDLLEDIQKPEENYNVLWAHYHDAEDMLRNTCDDIPYEVEVDRDGYLIFTHKSKFNIDVINDIEEDEFLTSANSTVSYILGFHSSRKF